MKVNITCRHMEVTPALRDHAQQAVENALAEFPRIEHVHLIMDVEKYRHFAEVVVQAKNHIRVEGKEESDDMYFSIESALGKAQKQLRKHRDKIQNHKQNEGLGELEAHTTSE
ncbi:MAG: putative sigma-54 modulation protein [Candidatus Omnitrophota bacterium]|jgi:putative sigma-54 modulation protein